MIKRLYLVARTLLDSSAVQSALAVVTVSVGLGKLSQLCRDREQLLTALNGQIAERRHELARLTTAIRAAVAEAPGYGYTAPAVDEPAAAGPEPAGP